MKARSSARFIQLLIGKSVIEALFIALVSIGFYLATTNPNIRGWLDVADRGSITGWVVDDANASTRVEVQLFIDDKFIENRAAADSRPDLVNAKRTGDEWHGFVFATPPLSKGEHEARVYAVHRGLAPSRVTLQMVGKPLRFRIE